MAQQGFADVVAIGTAGLAGELVETFFRVGVEADGKHRSPRFVSDKYDTSGLSAVSQVGFSSVGLTMPRR
jgi:hypothetical protein